MHSYTVAEVAATLDHAVLKPEFTAAEVASHARMCLARGVKSICVRPCDVALAAQCLAGSTVLVSTVIGFPHGHHRPEVKALEASWAITDGARELDMVMNLGQFLSGEHDRVRRDIAAVVAVAKPHGVLVKVILESGMLTLDQVAQACLLAEAAGADFVKTSTGFGPGGATPEAVAVMLKTVGGRLGVKASGGIRDWPSAVGYLAQGANRLGVGATEAILEGGMAEGGY
ncbi:MAG: deoxyribose-phosphate aldolase [Verrucomicrobiota bacterium]